MNKILVALDLEAGSDAVLGRAAQLAAEHAAWLVLLHVIEAEPLSDAADASGCIESELRDQLKEPTVERLDALLINSGRTRRSEARVEFGSSHEVIVRLADELSADLVVIGPGKTENGSLLTRILGSTADRVIRTSPTPVLVVTSVSTSPYRRVAVAVDFSPQSASAAREARKLAPTATIELIHVVEFPLTFEQAMLRTGTPTTAIDRYHAARTKKASGDLAMFASKIKNIGAVSSRCIEGTPGPVLAHLSHADRIELLALGAHGHGVVLQTLLGSVTHYVLRGAACDVLVVKAKS